MSVFNNMDILNTAGFGASQTGAGIMGVNQIFQHQGYMSGPTLQNVLNSIPAAFGQKPFQVCQ